MHDLFPIKYSYLIPLLPLAGAAISGFFGAKWLRGKSHWPVWIGCGASMVLSLWLLFAMLGYWHAPSGGNQQVIGFSQTWYHWVTAGNPANIGKPGHDSFFDATAGAWIDPLTAIMLGVVTLVGFLITIYSAGYMQGEAGYFRFFAYMGLFIFMMTCLVMGDNLLMLYLGWEGVGLCSYLLIGYYYERPSAREAAKKAFLVNRVGDFGFGIGIMLCFLAFGTISFFGNGIHTNTGLLELVQSHNLTSFQRTALQWIPFLLLIGACGKSAQFPLYVWLPDAMEGPTPVSALIHAATMVTAGVYMMVRCGTLFVSDSTVLWTIAAIGCFTAILSAIIALRQFDLKKVFAYSTISQLGYMFVAVGCLAPVAGVFHLVTHAFFKALLFLTCGVVMHAMAGQLDMRTMSGLKRVLPKTRWLMLIGCLALAGCPLFSGFFSKDDIIASAWTANHILGALMLFAAFLTAYYTFRLYFRVFEGPLVLPEGVEHPAGTVPEEHAGASSAAVHTGDTAISGVDRQLATDPAHHGKVVRHQAHGPNGHEHNHEPGIMIWPLILLAIGALFAGYINFPERAASLGSFLGSSPSLAESYDRATAHSSGYVIDPAPFGQYAEAQQGQTEAIKAQTEHLHWIMMGISAVIFAIGVYLAYLGHLKYRAADDRLALRLGPLTRLIEAKFWVDEIYQGLFVEPLRAIGKLFYGTDRWGVDGVLGIFSVIPQSIGFVIKFTTQRGYLQGYAASMLLGIAIIVIVVLWR